MMKSLHSLTQQIEIWWKKSSQIYVFLWERGRKGHLFPSKTQNRNLNRKSRIKRTRLRHSLLILIIAIFSLTSVVGYRFYNQPQLTVGKISPVTIKAPRDAQFEDKVTTLEKRKEVQIGIIPILKQDREITNQTKLQLSNYLTTIDELRKLVQPFPFIDTGILSLETQQYLRCCDESQFKILLESLTQQSLDSQPNSPANNTPDFNVALRKAVTQLKAYRQETSPKKLESLMIKVTLIRYRYAQTLKKFRQQPIPFLNETEVETLFNFSDRDWQKTKNVLNLATQRILAQGIAPGIPSDILEQAVNVQLNPDIPPSASHLATNLLLGILQPNLQEDREATKNIAEKAAEAIAPVIASVKEGEIIVAEGETISQTDFVLLDGLGLSRREINWLGIRLSIVVVTSIIGIFLSIQHKIYPCLRRRDYLLLCLLSLTTPILTLFNIPYTNLSAVAVLISSFYSPLLAVCHIILLAILVSFSGVAISWEYLLAGSAGGIVAAAIAGRLRSREAMSRLGLIVGLTQGGIYFITHLILSASAVTIWSAILPGAIIFGLSGVAWSIVAIGVSPSLERCFDLITPIRLAELSNPNLPLLKRLATEAPGTFQHTMFVASLAESAARELNCNVELVRAGTLYHDIGKMHDPLGFIENQMGGPNKHDAINDPWKSAEIIKKHVTEGLVMARKYGLPKAIRDFIPEHQGTLLIAYFYHQAKQQTNEPVLESDFCYDGPIPQSREAGIMMLADGCEAALRSLTEATPEQALATIKKIFKARWKDQQLCDSGLSYEELPIIAEVFVQVWQQFNHKRIAYPKGALDSK
ncbi:MAG: HDIG domain-containing protein [Xenococcaceae cyanobacterium MO_167.B27]|nr:HDIG domain-containing protein [Xenococcaceae cyanobacterium MO_167.B27]